MATANLGGGQIFGEWNRKILSRVPIGQSTANMVGTRALQSSRASLTAFAISNAVWLIIVQWLSSALYGYNAG